MFNLFKISTIYIVLILSGSVYIYANEQELPPAPDGFTWTRLTEIQGALLKPDHWHLKHVSKPPNLYAWFISKQDIDKKGQFETGLSYNCIKNITKQKGKDTPPSRAAKQIYIAHKKYRKIESLDTKTEHGLYVIRYVSIDHKPSLEDIRVFTLLYADDKKDILHFIVFEAPVKQWNEAWSIGDVILKKILIMVDP